MFDFLEIEYKYFTYFKFKKVDTANIGFRIDEFEKAVYSPYIPLSITNIIDIEYQSNSGNVQFFRNIAR